MFRQELKQKYFLISISEFAYYSFCLNHLEFEWKIRLLYTLPYCSFLENHTRFQTKMGKIYTHFQPKTAQNLYMPFELAHTVVA